MPSSPPSSTPFGTPSLPFSIDSPDMCRAGRELLSLALIDARNHTLHLLALYEQALDSAALAVPRQDGVEPPVWLAGHIGWFAEWWIGRNTQRAFGIDCPVRPTRLAAIEPQADACWNPAQIAWVDRWSPELPDLAQTKAYLLDTLESTLELLEHAVETDTGLYFYRLALFHEDLRGEQLVVMAQTLGLPLGIEQEPAAVVREPLLIPATAWELGVADAGFAFAQERGHLQVEVPEFEIDAQPVTWSQYVEFVDDGGYDREDLWHPEGLQWLERQAEGRRGPRHVVQIGAARRGTGGSLLQHRARGGQPERGARGLVGGRCLGALGRAPSRDRGGVGDRSPHRCAPRLPLGRRPRMDRGHAEALAGFPCRPLERRYRIRPAAGLRPGPRAARRIACHARAPALAEAPRLCHAALRRRFLRVSHLRILTTASIATTTSTERALPDGSRA